MNFITALTTKNVFEYGANKRKKNKCQILKKQWDRAVPTSDTTVIKYNLYKEYTWKLYQYPGLS